MGSTPFIRSTYFFAGTNPLKQIYVSNDEELKSAVAALYNTTDGGYIILKGGSYGQFLFKTKSVAKITFISEATEPVLVDKINLYGATNFTFVGITFNGFAAERGSKNIEVINCKSSILYFRSVDGLNVIGNTVKGGRFGIILNSIANFNILGNRVSDSVEDLFRITGNSYNGVVENNIFLNTVGGRPIHPDTFQCFGADSITPHDIIIRGNILYDRKETPDEVQAQGIFLADPKPDGYRNLLVENNLISVQSPNTIYISNGSENVVIRNNILVPGAGDGGAVIRLAGDPAISNKGVEIYGNVAKMLLDETKNSNVHDNYFYGRHADISKIFAGTDFTKREAYKLLIDPVYK